MKRAILFLVVGLAAGAGGTALVLNRGAATREQASKELAQRAAKDLEERNSEIRRLQEKLLEKEKAWESFHSQWNAAQEAGQKNTKPNESLPKVPVESPASSDPASFLARFQRVMQEQSQREWTLEECGRVQDGVVAQASLFRRSAQGAVSGMIFCARMTLSLPAVPDVAWLHCYEGHVIEDGRKSPLPEQGYRIELAPVNLAELKEALPEFFAGAAAAKPLADDSRLSATSGMAPAAKSSVEALRERLEALWAKDPGGYRLIKLGAVRDGMLLDVEVEELSGGTHLARFVAATATPRFEAASKSVELILERGSVERNGKLTPIPATGLRLHFPKITPSAWKAAGGPTPR